MQRGQMLFASPPLPPGHHKAWSGGTCTAALYERGTMIQPGSSKLPCCPAASGKGMLSHTAPPAWLKERGVFVRHVALKPMKHRRKAQETQCDTCGQHVTGEARGWEKPRKRSVQTGLCAHSPALGAPHPPTQPADLQP